MRKIFIAGNWKMNNGLDATKTLLEALKPLVADIKNVDIAVAPTYTSLAVAGELLKNSNIALSAQNISWADSGAFTGEIPAAMLKEAGCTHAIIGHSERRAMFGETNESVAKRCRKALDVDLTPIVCIGESLEEREAGKTMNVVLSQLTESLASVKANEADRVVIAYEPVWAIGTGKTASPEQAQEVHAAIRAKLGELFGTDVAEKMRIQYGGSVKPTNAKELLSQKDIDGALVGGASLKADSFKGIIDAAVEVSA